MYNFKAIDAESPIVFFFLTVDISQAPEPNVTSQTPIAN